MGVCVREKERQDERERRGERNKDTRPLLCRLAGRWIREVYGSHS